MVGVLPFDVIVSEFDKNVFTADVSGGDVVMVSFTFKLICGNNF